MALAAVWCASAAWADSFDSYGYGPRAAAMSGAMTAAANDHTAVFYNPALLPDSKDVNFGFAFHFQRMVADVKAQQVGAQLDCSACTAPDVIGYSVGLLFPLGGKVKNRVALGLGVYLPSQVLLRVNAPDANTPYWYQYNANPERVAIYFAAGVKITDWFKVGAGIQALADLVGTGAQVRVDFFSKEVKLNQLNSYLGTRVAPVFGVQVSPLSWLRFGVTYRWEMKLIFEVPATVDLEGVGQLAFAARGVAHYSPHTVAFGAAVDPLPELTLSLDGEWKAWSAAPSPYVNLVIDFSGKTLDGLGLGSALDVASTPPRPNFSDTLSVRAGAEYRLSPRFAVRLGGAVRPTPVPQQDSAGTNLLDNLTLGISGGVGFNFPDPLEIFASPIQIDLAGQAGFILPRAANKDPFGVVPSYVASARVAGATAAIRYDF